MARKWRKSRSLRIFKPVLRALLLLVLLGLSFVYAMFQGGFVSWFLFYSFLPFAVYSGLLFMYPMQGFKVTRKVSTHKVSAGNHLTIIIKLKRKIPFPLLFLIIEDVIPDELYSETSKQMIFLGFKRECKITYHIERATRGEHRFEAIRLKIGDALGIVEKERYFDCQNTILVYPQMEDMIYRPFESQFEQGGTLSGMQFQKNTSLVAGIRQYQPGDRLAWIDWKSTARTNDMMSKEFEIRQSNDLLIVLNRTPTDQFEAIVKFAASAIRAILTHGGQVGLFSAGEARAFIPIKGGEQQQARLLDHLARVKVTKGLHFAKFFSEEAVLYQQPANLLIITASLDRDMIESTSSYMRRRGALFIYLIKKDGEVSLGEEESLIASVLQSGIIIKTVYESNFRTAFSEVSRA